MTNSFNLSRGQLGVEIGRSYLRHNFAYTIGVLVVDGPSAWELLSVGFAYDFK